MHNTLRNIALIIRREYLQRVRTKSFMITTLLIPAMMLGFTVLPSVFMSRKLGSEKKIVVVSDNPKLASDLKSQFSKDFLDSGYSVQLEMQATDAKREQLKSQAISQQIDGFLWFTQDAVANGKVEFSTRSSSDFQEIGGIETAIKLAVPRYRLSNSGIREADLDAILKPVELKSVPVQAGKPSGDALFLTAFLLVMILYMTVIIHGVAVMRSVLEEKTSRVMELLLSAVTPKELMAGKIIGVGAVGLTQILVWAVLALASSMSGIAVMANAMKQIHLSAALVVFFAVFYLLGFLLYSSYSAALGAMVNSEEEAQQLQFFVMLPIIAAMMFMFLVFRAPSSTPAVVLSLIPFFAPILMYLRIAVEQPPVWQIALCLALMIATIYGVLIICARIYRVGILMYGKRPTLPEIMKWIKYA